MKNCEMCLFLGSGRKCFHYGRNLKFKEANENDATMKSLKETIAIGWPDRKTDLPQDFIPTSHTVMR